MQISGANIGIETAYNKLQLLSHTQFIEQKVGEDVEENAGEESGASAENAGAQNGVGESLTFEVETVGVGMVDGWGLSLSSCAWC